MFPYSGCGEVLETEVLEADTVSVCLESAYGLDEGACTDAAKQCITDERSGTYVDSIPEAVTEGHGQG